MASLKRDPQCPTPQPHPTMTPETHPRQFAAKHLLIAHNRATDPMVKHNLAAALHRLATGADLNAVNRAITLAKDLMPPVCPERTATWNAIRALNGQDEMPTIIGFTS